MKRFEHRKAENERKPSRRRFCRARYRQVGHR